MSALDRIAEALERIADRLDQLGADDTELAAELFPIIPVPPRDAGRGR